VSPPDPAPEPRGAAAVPRWLHTGAAWSWRLLLVAAAFLGSLWVLRRLQFVVLPVAIALGVACVLGPAARRLEARGWRPLLAAWVVVGGSFLVVAGIVAALAPSVVNELGDVGDSLDEARADIEDWLRDGPLHLDERDIERLEDAVEVGGDGLSPGTARRGVTLVLELLTGALLTLVLTFFFVKDGPNMWRWVVDRVAPERRDVVGACGLAARRTLAAYLVGVAMAGTIEGIAIGIGLWIIGVPLVIPLAVITFFAAFVPIVGATVAGALAALVALASGGTGDAVLVAVLAVVIQQLDGDVLQPLIMRRQVSLHPAVVLIALAAGGTVAGIVGAVVAVPVAAVALAVGREVRVARLATPTSTSTSGGTAGRSGLVTGSDRLLAPPGPTTGTPPA
jgi:putative heme transporter